MKKIYVIKNGILGVGVSKKNGKRPNDGNFYLICRNFVSNTGYISRKELEKWRLYTSIGGSEDKKSRYHHFNTFEECVQKLQELCDNMIVEVIDISVYEEVFINTFSPESTKKNLGDYSNDKLIFWLSNHYNENDIDFKSKAKSKLKLLIVAIRNSEELCKKYQDNHKLLEEINFNHSMRLQKLKEIYETELLTIRPEDIPDFFNK